MSQGEDCRTTELYALYRDYIKHEDDLINQRTSWFIQLHSFLIASYSLAFSALVGSYTSSSDPWEFTPIRIVGAAILAAIGVVGLQSSNSARRSVMAALESITELRTKGDGLIRARTDGDSFPPLTGGGSKGAGKEGGRLGLLLPQTLHWLWVFSFTVPACFLVLAFHKLL